MFFPGWCRRSLLLSGFSDDDDGLLRSRLDFSSSSRFLLPSTFLLDSLGFFFFYFASSYPLFWLGLFTYGILL